MQLTPQVIRYQPGIIGHSKAKKIMVAEASDLGLRGFMRLYDDACDVGIALQNPRTGNITRWAMADTITQDGDILGWMCIPCTESVRRHPELAGYTLNIVND